MKKNKMMRLASAMMVMTLMTTSVISGTFAKYVTSDEGSDKARVAKWGVVVAATGSLYGEKYAAEDSKITALEDEDKVSVWGKQYTDNNNVVAPGTMSDKGFQFDINGKPEVDAKVTVQMEHQNIFLAKGKYGVMVGVKDVTEENFPAEGLYTETSGNYTLVTVWDKDVTKWYALHDEAEVVNEDGYWPVVYTMTGDTNYTGDQGADSLKAIADKIAARFTSSTVEQDSIDKSKWTYQDMVKDIEQNTLLSEVLYLGNIGLSWAWEFEGVNDGADTILGNLMAERINDFTGDVVMSTGTGTYGQLVEGTDFCLDTNFSIEILVEQVD